MSGLTHPKIVEGSNFAKRAFTTLGGLRAKLDRISSAVDRQLFIAGLASYTFGAIVASIGIDRALAVLEQIDRNLRDYKAGG